MGMTKTAKSIKAFFLYFEKIGKRMRRVTEKIISGA
jgi:hypothetical protein